jgi:outer membrane protein, heavy metal efflux system
MSSRNIRWLLVLGIVAASSVRQARAQAPTLGTELPQGSAGLPGTTASMLGPIPGSGGGTFASQAAGGGQILGGRAGTATPRVPTSISTPGLEGNPLAPTAVQAIPAVAPLTQVPLYGTLDLPATEDDGPANGLSFDQALERLIHENLDLRSRKYEIPSSQADILTASLRGNPILYADSQLIPYGAYSKTRQGGPLQYDVNVSQPVDYSHKRLARIAVAKKTKEAVELQYQDAVRVQIGNLSTAYVGVLSARETLRYAQAGLEGIERMLTATRRLQIYGNRTSADVLLLEAQRAAARVGVRDAQESLRRAKVTLGGYLNLPPDQSERIEVRASLRDLVPAIPPIDVLVSTALSCRPDVVAYRVGVDAAKEAFRLQKANRFADAYVLYQPYTFQNLSYLGHSPGVTSWALGVTIPLPVFNRNQGNIERARINIEQTEVQLEAVQRMVVNEVRQAEQEYLQTREYLADLERESIPAARKALADTEKLFEAGEVDVTNYLAVQKSFNGLVQLYRDTAVRHRRSMFTLNTVVGSRLLP